MAYQWKAQAAQTSWKFTVAAIENLLPDPDTILQSAGGNYKDDTLIPANVRQFVEYGIGEEGTLIPMTPTISEVKTSVARLVPGETP